MILSMYFIWFLIYSFAGWIFESIYCTVNAGKWSNRGFLYGPVCPIYGAGGVLITIVMNFVTPYLSGGVSVWWQVFLISFFGSAVLEYSVSLLLEKLFHAYWWDYSNLPLNLNGRICLPAATLFGLGGLFIIYVTEPALTDVFSHVHPLAIELISLIAMGVLSMDTTLTVSALTSFEYQVADIEDSINVHMELFVEGLQERTQDMTRRLAEERDRFSMQAMEAVAGRMRWINRSAVKRVVGFRPRRRTAESVEKEKRNILLTLLKNGYQTIRKK